MPTHPIDRALVAALVVAALSSAGPAGASSPGDAATPADDPASVRTAGGGTSWPVEETRLLATNRTSTMQKEMTEAAADGGWCRSPGRPRRATSRAAR